MAPEDDFSAGMRAHFDQLVEAWNNPPAEPKADSIMPLHAPEWLWEAWEAHELVWQGLELTFAQIHALPDTEPGECSAEEEFVWTREEIDRDRDFEGGSADDGRDE